MLGTIASRIAVRNSGTLIARYGYGVLGRRIVKRVYSGISGGDPAYTRFVYRGDQVAYETDSAGTVGMRYSWGYGIDDLAAFRDPTGNRYTTVQDPLHSVRGLVDSAGTWKMSQRFTPYGALQARDSAGAIPTLRYQWTGRGCPHWRGQWHRPLGVRFSWSPYKGDPQHRTLNSGTPQGGWSVATEAQFNANAGLYYAAGVSATYGQDGSFGVSGSPMVRVGVGYGAQTSLGVVRTANYATAPVLGWIMRVLGIGPDCSRQ